MAVTTVLKGIKLVLNLEKGSQTVAHCNAAASNESLNALGKAVANLVASPVETIVKVEETVLIEE
ncbi:DUF1659 domain-containing protein [Cellulosilyticum ruminicola]|uniref:DUF1659 domain-containing protein n=1 Tax=Cellulosilyticum ruminicola TaxID=425254 RepID=UPI0006D183FB|nr:hypothetical protein [Cellulosilyticum ruminicola]